MASLRAWIHTLLEDWRHWRRGFKRVAPRFNASGEPTRGRVYARPEPAPLAAATAPFVSIEARHFGPDGELKGVHRVTGRPKES